MCSNVLPDGTRRDRSQRLDGDSRAKLASMLATRCIEGHDGGHEGERRGDASAYRTSCREHDQYDAVDRTNPFDGRGLL
jgi:hypothetical protein